MDFIRSGFRGDSRGTSNPTLTQNFIIIDKTFAFTGPIPTLLTYYKRATNEASLAETSLSGPENLQLKLFSIF